VKKMLVGLLLPLLGSVAQAQITPPPVWQWGGNITAANSNCIVTACVSE
jgi:hypothetical protein